MKARRREKVALELEQCRRCEVVGCLVRGQYAHAVFDAIAAGMEQPECQDYQAPYWDRLCA